MVTVVGQEIQIENREQKWTHMQRTKTYLAANTITANGDAIESVEKEISKVILLLSMCQNSLSRK